MKYVDEFRNKGLMEPLSRRIRAAADESRIYYFMEVCGTHTMNIFRYGLRGLLPDNISLISGPGCPVCVTPNTYIDKAVALSRIDNVIVAVFGDMFRVPGSSSSLERERGLGRQIKMVYSTLDALDIARKNPDKEVIFLGIGFETTIPTVAMSIMIAEKEGIDNYSVLCGHKTMPEALKALVCDAGVVVDGFLLPGHVSAVIGARPYKFLSATYKKRCVISGFEPLDILQAILMLLTQKAPDVEVQYTRVISSGGNSLAKDKISKVFSKTSSVWRGIGSLEKSGLKIKDRYRRYDAERKFSPRVEPSKENRLCICGDVLKGIKTPTECALYKKSCNPENPVGSCMVSSEGTCAAYYRYNG